MQDEELLNVIEKLKEKIEVLEKDCFTNYELINRIVINPIINNIIHSYESDEKYIKQLHNEIDELNKEKEDRFKESMLNAKQLYKAIVEPFISGELKVVKGQNYE